MLPRFSGAAVQSTFPPIHTYHTRTFLNIVIRHKYFCFYFLFSFPSSYQFTTSLQIHQYRLLVQQYTLLFALNIYIQSLPLPTTARSPVDKHTVTSYPIYPLNLQYAGPKQGCHGSVQAETQGPSSSPSKRRETGLSPVSYDSSDRHGPILGWHFLCTRQQSKIQTVPQR
jgi:hypothetical protein